MLSSVAQIVKKAAKVSKKFHCKKVTTVLYLNQIVAARWRL
jgi:hypothetical protein